MMNDIELIPTEEGFFDWNFDNGKISNVTGDQQLISAVTHTLMLHFGELEQEVYTNNGCNVYDYLKLPMTNRTRELIKGEIENSCRLVKGVKDVSVEVEAINIDTFKASITITKANGGVIIVGF